MQSRPPDRFALAETDIWHLQNAALANPDFVAGVSCCCAKKRTCRFDEIKNLFSIRMVKVLKKMKQIQAIEENEADQVTRRRRCSPRRRVTPHAPNAA